MPSKTETWPELPYAAWKDTCATLQLWTQIVGKIRLVQTPWLNHSWHVVLYVTPRGLTTAAIPYGDRSFQLDFDFLDHVLRISTSDGGKQAVGLYPRSVADFYANVMRALSELGIDVRIDELPNEIPDAIRFSQDQVHASYDRDFAQAFWRILLQSARVLERFRTSFIGKCSPVHFFWGSFDLAVTRFSGVGRRNSPAPAAFRTCPRPWCSTPFARGQQRRLLAGRAGDRLPRLLLLCRAAPEGFAAAKVRPADAAWNPGSQPIPPALRCGSHRRRSGADPDGVPDQHL